MRLHYREISDGRVLMRIDAYTYRRNSMMYGNVIRGDIYIYIYYIHRKKLFEILSFMIYTKIIEIGEEALFLTIENIFTYYVIVQCPI